MKKLLVLGLLLGSFNVANAACVGPYCYNDTGAQVPTSTLPLGITSKTLAEMNAYTPGAAGELIYVSDGLQARVCVSSGATRGGFVVVSATSTVVAGGLLGHCN